jgi:hypothetical protein
MAVVETQGKRDLEELQQSHVEAKRFLKSRFDGEEKAEATAHKESLMLMENSAKQRMQEARNRHQELMADSDLANGRKAAAAHESEWEKRKSHDAAYAQSPMETTLLEMERISKDRTATASEVLKKIAKLASPKNSDVAVTATDGDYVVDVAFDMSAMSHGETGSSTKHDTKEALQVEVREIIGRVMKDLYDHCGDRNIKKISVACKHGVRQQSIGFLGGLAPGTTEIKEIYRCAIRGTNARKITDWRNAPLHRVTDMLEVEMDGFPDLQIRQVTIPIPTLKLR